MITFATVQHNTEVDADPWVQADLLHAAAHLIPLFHTKRKAPELPSATWCVPCERNMSQKTLMSNTKNRNGETGVLCHLSYHAFTKQTLRLACLGKWYTELVHTLCWAQESHDSQGSHTQLILPSDLACVTTKLAELCPSASYVKRTSS